MKMRTLSLLLITLATLSTCLAAATKKAPAKKPASTTHHETVGTQQLKGGFGLIGHTYTLGKAEPWNIRLNSADYSVDIMPIGDRTIYPKANEKLLVLHYTVHNPNKQEALMRYDAFRFTAVDAKDKNWEYAGDISSEKTKARVDQNMKPAQKMDLYTVIAVPAAGEIPKLMLISTDELVIRYDLRGKVKGLKAPYADPNDKTGATALETVQAKFGEYYPMVQFLIKVEGTGLSDQAIGEVEPDEGGRLFIVAATAKNVDVEPALLRYDTFEVQIRDTDGAEVDASVTEVLRASSDKPLSTEVEPGQEIKFRMVFRVESGIEPKTLTVKGEEEGRAFKYELK